MKYLFILLFIKKSFPVVLTALKVYKPSNFFPLPKVSIYLVIDFQSYLHIFGFFHLGASFGTFTGVLELSLEFPVDMEYVKGVFSISLVMQLRTHRHTLTHTAGTKRRGRGSGGISSRTGRQLKIPPNCLHMLLVLVYVCAIDIPVVH